MLGLAAITATRSPVASATRCVACRTRKDWTVRGSHGLRNSGPRRVRWFLVPATSRLPTLPEALVVKDTGGIGTQTSSNGLRRAVAMVAISQEPSVSNLVDLGMNGTTARMAVRGVASMAAREEVNQNENEETDEEEEGRQRSY